MFKTSRRVRGVVAAASLLVAGGAFAEGTFTPELGIAQTSGKNVRDVAGRTRDPARRCGDRRGLAARARSNRWARSASSRRSARATASRTSSDTPLM